MTRTLHTDVQSALQAEVVRPITMLRLDLDSGIITVHSAIGDLDWNGETYLGVGNFGELTAIEESTSIAPSGVKATLSGIPTEYISLILGQHYQGRPAQVYVAMLDENYELIGDPALAFEGKCDFADIGLSGEAAITLSIESRLADWQRPRIRRYTDEDQKAVYPLDKGLEFIAGMTEKSIVWGK